MIKYDDILWVKVLHDDIQKFDYCFVVKTRFLELHEYINIENKKTVKKEYAENRLPVNVQKFIKSHDRKWFGTIDDVTHYIYK